VVLKSYKNGLFFGGEFGIAMHCNGAIARYLPNSAIFCRPTIGPPKASALAAHPIYLFTLVLATPFPSL